MQEPMLFYLVFLSQVLLVSFYFPRKLLRRVRYVVDTYPPSQYPKLYPVPIDVAEKAQRNYRNVNVFALIAGLALVFTGLYSRNEEMLNWDTISVLTIYMAIQYSPMMIAATSGFTYFNLKRKTDSRTTRRAELQPRRLFDFISPTVVGLAIFVYIAFVLLIVYVRQFEFSWFGGYWNIFAVTAANLFFAGVIVQSMYGKKKDPYQAHEDRIRQIELNIKVLFFSSIMATVFVAMAIALQALDFGHLIPTFLSLYCQLLALISFRAFRIDNVNFEVYREDPLVT